MTGSGRVVRSAVALAVALIVLVAGQGVAHAEDPGAEADFVNRINGARAANGRGALAVDGELTGIARRWSQQMANSQRLSHNPNLSREVTQDWEKLAENVGFGPDVASIHDAFMNSSAHRANILDPVLTRVGVGVVVDGSGQLWVTEVFMRLRSDSGGGSTATTAPPPPPPTTAPPAPRPTSPPTTRAPRPAPTTTAPPAPPPTDPPPPPEPEPAPAPAETAPTPTPTRRLILVLDGLRDLDAGR